MESAFNKYESLQGNIYVLEGTIGVGKTTLGKSMSTYLNSLGFNCRFFEEYVNMDLLKLYLGNKPKYAFVFQIIMLFKRIEIYKQAQEFVKNGGIAILDRGFHGDAVFATVANTRGHISDEELKIYFKIFYENFEESKAIINLNCCWETAYERIQKRGIESEKNGYTLNFLARLQRAYNLHLAMYENVIEISWNKSRMVISESDLCEILDRLTNDDLVFKKEIDSEKVIAKF